MRRIFDEYQNDMLVDEDEDANGVFEKEDLSYLEEKINS
jgi:hypothetical protein